MSEKKCRICTTGFSPPKNRAVYCGYECGDYANRFFKRRRSSTFSQEAESHKVSLWIAARLLLSAGKCPLAVTDCLHPEDEFCDDTQAMHCWVAYLTRAGETAVLELLQNGKDVTDGPDS